MSRNDPARRVLFVLQSVAVGGMETQCAELVAEFVGIGLPVAVVLPVSEAFADLGHQLVAAGAHVARFVTDARSGRAAQLLGMLRLLVFMRRWRPDVVHLHTGGATGGVAVLATVVKDRSVHALITLSARNAEFRQRRLGAPKRKFVGIRPGVRTQADGLDRSSPELAIRARFEIAPDAIVIGSTVRLAPDKGLDDLLRAFALVVRDQPCYLLLVGDGPLRAALEVLVADLGIGERVRFAGYQHKPMSFFHAMDIFTLAIPVGSGSIALLRRWLGEYRR